MKRWGLVLVAVSALGIGACDDDDSPTAPSNQPLVFTAALAAANEVPAIVGPEAAGAGNATITVTPTRDTSNAITGGTISFAFTVTGLTPTSSVRLAHIHTGVAGVAGPIVVDTGLSAATAIATPAGSAGFQSPTPVTADAATISAIVANPANYYFNVHSALNPGGVVRGQLRAQ